MKQVIQKALSVFFTYDSCSPIKKGVLAAMDWIISAFFGVIVSLKVGVVQLMPDAFGMDKINPTVAGVLQVIGVLVVIFWGIMRGWNELEKAKMKRQQRRKEGGSHK